MKNKNLMKIADKNFKFGNAQVIVPKTGIPVLKTSFIYPFIVLGPCGWEYVIIFLNLSHFSEPEQ